MTHSLLDELDAAFREIDDLTERWEQTQVYEQGIQRLRYLAPIMRALVDDVRYAHASLPVDAWSCLQDMLLRERPKELAQLGRALITGDECFMRIVTYSGFARGVMQAMAIESRSARTSFE